MILTAEQEVRQLSAEEKQAMNDYKPPKVNIGEPVVYHLRASQRPQDTSLGWVWDNRNPRCIKIFVPHESGGSGGAVRDGVFHVTDPRLQLSQDVRDNGSWDFTDSEKARRAEIEEIKDRMTQLELYRVFSGSNDRHLLVSIVRRLGIPYKRTDDNDTLRKKMADGLGKVAKSFSVAEEACEDGEPLFEPEDVEETE